MQCCMGHPPYAVTVTVTDPNGVRPESQGGHKDELYTHGAPDTHTGHLCVIPSLRPHHGTRAGQHQGSSAPPAVRLQLTVWSRRNGFSCLGAGPRQNGDPDLLHSVYNNPTRAGK